MVTFAAPILALAGLAAAMVPLLIHLLWRRRRQPIEWAAMELLAQAIRRRRRRLELERLLLLAVRMAILALVGLAIAQPFLDGSPGSSSRRIWIVLDDGVASMAQPEEGAAEEFVSLRNEAEQLLDSLEDGDAAGIILASRPPRVLAATTTDLSSVRSRLGSLEATSMPTDLRGAIELAREPREAEMAADAIVVLSALRAGSLPPEAPIEEEPPATRLVVREPAEAPIRNIRISQVEASRSPTGDPTALVRVRLEREGPLEESVSRVVVAGPELPEAVERRVAWPAGRASTEVDLSMPLPVGGEEVDSRIGFVVSIDPDGQPADDRLHATIDARLRSRVGIVGETTSRGADWISSAMAPSREAPVETVPIEPGLLEARTVRDLDALVILRPDRIASEGWEAARALVDRGGLVLVLPPPDLLAHEWLDRLAAFAPLGDGWALRREVEESLDAPRSIDPRRVGASWLPAIGAEAVDLVAPVSIFRRLAFEASPSSDEIVLALSDTDEGDEASGALKAASSGDPIVVAASDPASGGSLVLFAIAADLAWSDLPIRPLMVPLAQELLRSGLSRGERGRRFVVGEAGTLAPPATSVRAPSGEVIELGSDRLLEREITEPGPHRLLDPSDREIGLVAANIDLAAASVVPTPRAEIAARLGESASEPIEVSAMPELLSGGSKGLPVAAILAWIALGLAVLEILLARRFSHAARERRRDDGEAPAFLEGFVATSKGRRA